jgi:hypothetical protein
MEISKKETLNSPVILPPLANHVDNLLCCLLVHLRCVGISVYMYVTTSCVPVSLTYSFPRLYASALFT